jgi:hypothetical protein
MITRIYLLFLLLLFSGAGQAQENNNNETLDDYFAGVPLKEDFAKWFYYVRQHPFLRIDSIGKRGYYSSFKPGIKNHFPFHDSLPVKLLLKKTIFRDSLTKTAYDSVVIIMIEGVFTDDKDGRKKSRKAFKEIRKKLRRHYKQEDSSRDGWGSRLKKGKSLNFPDCSIWQGYEDSKKFYYVLIAYEFPARTEQPWYLELAS